MTGARLFTSYFKMGQAHIDGQPVIGNDTVLMPFAVVGRVPLATAANRRPVASVGEACIGPGCVIGSHAVVYRGAHIGAECQIGDHASIREQVRIGNRCVISRHVSINYEVTIGDDVRIMDGSHITGRMSIGDGSFIGVGVITSNDRRIDLDDYDYRPDQVHGPIIGRNVVVGSGANLLAGITIGDGAVIAAGAIVTRDVPAGGFCRGEPARLAERA